MINVHSWQELEETNKSPLITVKGFFGDFRFLSNFWLCTIKIGNLYFSSTEAAYQASKTDDGNWHRLIETMSPFLAKSASENIKLRENWDQVKLEVMYQLQTVKFSVHKNLKDKLLATGYAYLEEANTWGDTFWGTCGGVGENNLGKILVRVRENLRNVKKVS